MTASAAADAYLLGLLPSILLSPWALIGLAALPSAGTAVTAAVSAVTAPRRSDSPATRVSAGIALVAGLVLMTTTVAERPIPALVPQAARGTGPSTQTTGASAFGLSEADAAEAMDRCGRDTIPEPRRPGVTSRAVARLRDPGAAVRLTRGRGRN